MKVHLVKALGFQWSGMDVRVDNKEDWALKNWCFWTGAKQDDWPEGRQRPRKLTLYKVFKLPKASILSLSLPAMGLSASNFLFNKLFTFLFTLCLLTWICSWLGRWRLGTLGPTAGPWSPVIRTPRLGSWDCSCCRSLLLANCCLLWHPSKISVVFSRLTRDPGNC